MYFPGGSPVASGGFLFLARAAAQKSKTRFREREAGSLLESLRVFRARSGAASLYVWIMDEMGRF
ncbi:MAG: hypothetical protein LBM04_13810 [Opitutaceae bacterium]|jgi:hypothetical protein|nr:hypothetical protein [Opitutaceae bacterium]